MPITVVATMKAKPESVDAVRDACKQAIEAVHSLDTSPDAVLVSGDLAEHAADSEYEQVRALLARIEAPSYVLPGNHDDRDALHRHFDVPGAGGQPVQYAVDLGPLRLSEDVVLQIASAYEGASKRRIPPPAFAPLPASKD